MPQKHARAKYVFFLAYFAFLSLVIIPRPVVTTPPDSSRPSSKGVQKLATQAKERDYDRTILGRASWYGLPFHGRLTANGEVYDMHALTAVHRSLPFDTMVKVTNLINGESVVVRINDRGPYVRGRHIDMSYAAAKQLNMVGDGVVPVKMEILLNRGKFMYRAPTVAKR